LLTKDNSNHNHHQQQHQPQPPPTPTTTTTTMEMEKEWPKWEGPESEPESSDDDDDDDDKVKRKRKVVFVLIKKTTKTTKTTTFRPSGLPRRDAARRGRLARLRGQRLFQRASKVIDGLTFDPDKHGNDGGYARNGARTGADLRPNLGAWLDAEQARADAEAARAARDAKAGGKAGEHRPSVGRPYKPF
jgi:hypothetical protein